MSRRQQERGRCGRVEVRDPETDETRGERESRRGAGAREETKTFPGAQLELTDGKKRGLWREEGRRKGKKGDQQRSEHVSV